MLNYIFKRDVSSDRVLEGRRPHGYGFCRRRRCVFVISGAVLIVRRRVAYMLEVKSVLCAIWRLGGELRAYPCDSWGHVALPNFRCIGFV